ncbi:heme NO-binding domain-containing protein [Thetidibacter halocola]|uniref:heme NO-binding domain-containing protein n=1 Tax=Thetidibacter halocola TaxID=2827239 RepID=UPI0031FEF691
MQDTYGSETWQVIAARANIDPPEFEAMLHYDPACLPAVLSTAKAVLNKPVESLLEDVGIYLISHPNCERLRRLMRFGGVDFIDFLHSLEDLPERTRLAVSDLTLPELELRKHRDGTFELRLCSPVPGYGHVMVGVLRAMADDYGALALLDHTGRIGDFETISIAVVETDYSEGRRFDLVGPVPDKKAG